LNCNSLDALSTSSRSMDENDHGSITEISE
jgi:hypothetical protein